MPVKILLKEIREAREVSLNDLSRLTGLSPQYLSKIENGKSNPTLKTIGDICQGLRIQPGDWIIYEFEGVD
jgi:transcriptional regulator with XRE-family HTH domain